MGEAGDSGLSQRVRNRNFPIDLLRRFAGNSSSYECPAPVVDGPGEVELSLGLSLGGCFGTDPRRKGIVRSSSIASLTFFPKEEDAPAGAGLNRASSLPVVTEEEENRKRKEFQSLRRSEAKRRRSEKRNSKSWSRDREQEGRWEEEMLDGEGRLRPGYSQFGVCNVLRRPEWVPGGNGAGAQVMVGKRDFGPVSQGSIGSQGSNSSGISDFDSLPAQGSDLWGGSSIVQEMRSPSITQPPNAGQPIEDPSKKNAIRGNIMKDMMDEMPCVSTRGNGPNGRRIEGFLYRYRKGEELRIVCVCHGSFLSPADFVKHAGGGEVDHPLRHIHVITSSSTFM